MKTNQTNVWLVNTGWSGGAFGVGDRIKLSYTRAMINAAVDGKLLGQPIQKHPIFGLQMPENCEGVPSEILDPRNTWDDKKAYDAKATQLSRFFKENFEKFSEKASPEIIKGGPQD
jgi:phosphoenolpyruvate carboxykinase (ATP)